ncbi:hypothetical protein AVDCRST_MAG84-782 [uncultured Microcoleus sp.]|uniref:Uncharacterized protein n=1 Tax=uncultured Microcoleus sp. TaxID=259945 RepID=A0A6J4KPH9_9CYAN|nr:hypothetical protein AVDCRST_MAG84-782 [uncultured Microcoleus sp.]
MRPELIFYKPVGARSLKRSLAVPTDSINPPPPHDITG